MKEPVRTTVLIPNYNGIKFIRPCLDSIRKAGDYPVIIVDNGSCDGAREEIEHYISESSQESGIRLIPLRENTGFCHAVNVGLKEVKTEFVFLLNNDTIIDKEAIDRLESCMDSDRRIFSAQSKILNLYNHDLIDDAGDLYCALGWAFARGKDKPAHYYTERARVFACCGAAVMYRMSMFDEIGGFDEEHFAYLEDIDMGYRAGIHGFKNIYEPSSVIYHAGSATSGSRHNSFKVKLSSGNSIYLIYKNMPLLQLLLNLPFIVIGTLIKLLFFARKHLAGAYLSGIISGFGKCARDIDNSRYHKVRFRFGHLRNYIRIQLELWINCIRRLTV